MVVSAADLNELKCWYSILVQYYSKRMSYGIESDTILSEFKKVLAYINISECSTVDHCLPLDYIAVYKNTELYNKVTKDICVEAFSCSLKITQETITDTACPTNNMKIVQL